jgi:hypothetical protein
VVLFEIGFGGRRSFAFFPEEGPAPKEAAGAARGTTALLGAGTAAAAAAGTTAGGGRSVSGAASLARTAGRRLVTQQSIRSYGTIRRRREAR